jgi:hypothetical protein
MNLAEIDPEGGFGVPDIDKRRRFSPRTDVYRCRLFGSFEKHSEKFGDVPLGVFA